MPNSNLSHLLTPDTATIENGDVRFIFDLKTGQYSGVDLKTNTQSISDAFFRVNEYSSTDGYSFTASLLSETEESLKLQLTGTCAGSPTLILLATVNHDDSAITLTCGIKASEAIRILSYSPIAGKAFAGHAFNQYSTLDGESGETLTTVSSTNERESFNNMLATFKTNEAERRSLVFGGLGYAEFVKHTKVIQHSDHLEITAWADDPYGKLLDPNTEYILDKDSFYLDFATNNPFTTLERYGQALKTANDVVLDELVAPCLNFWYCCTREWGGGVFRNNSMGTLEALEAAQKTGFLRYYPLGVRLEPDDYSEPNNQQGWWDDEHWQMYECGQLMKPCETIQKWGDTVYETGGTPFIYCQTARLSEDYGVAHPDHMLFGGKRTERRLGTLYWYDDAYWSYDFTSPGFIQHMQEVYQNLSASGVKGMKFDYPDTGWAYDGGFQNIYTTTTAAYRSIFDLAYTGLGSDSDIHERLPLHGDICLGAITTHRTEPDTDRYYPSMAKKCGLRWYKNRVVVKYVNDVINPEHAFPLNQDGWRTMYTMSYLTNGRIEIGKYIEDMTDEMRHDLSRIVPLYTEPKSAKPVDAFTGGEYPQIYQYAINSSWHIVAFYNTAIEQDQERAEAGWSDIPREQPASDDAQKIEVSTQWPDGKPGVREIPKTLPIPNTLSVSLSDLDQDGGLGLDENRSYYVYDFWNKHFIGKLAGTACLKQDLRAGETRIMAIHEVKEHPQLISTDRHIMQGYVDMVGCPVWDVESKTLSGVSKVISKEPYTITLAKNGYTPKTCAVHQGTCQIELTNQNNDMIEVTLNSEKNAEIGWTVHF